MTALPKAEMIMGYMILEGPFQPQTFPFYATFMFPSWKRYPEM